MIAGILLVQAVAFAVLSGIVASNKNRDAFGWVVLGFLFGLFAFIAALVVEEVEQEEKQSSPSRKQSSATQEFDPDEHEKKCPMCAEYIKLEARRCKHCGHEYSGDEVEQQIEAAKEEYNANQEKRDETNTSVQETSFGVNLDLLGGALLIGFFILIIVLYLST